MARKTRGLSISSDWNKVMGDGNAEEGPRRRSMFGGTGGGSLTGFRGIRPPEQVEENFPTGSHYSGQKNETGFDGFGTYTMPHGVEYEGYFEDGMFHGEGSLTYPRGQKLYGTWVNGKLTKYTYRFSDAQEVNDISNWTYCQKNDRCFQIDYQEGMQPCGAEHVKNSEVDDFKTRVRESTEAYDATDGFYDPKSGCVLREELHETKLSFAENILRIPTETERKLIIANYRKRVLAHVGYDPSLYDHWVSGRLNEMYALRDQETLVRDESCNDYNVATIRSTEEFESST